MSSLHDDSRAEVCVIRPSKMKRKFSIFSIAITLLLLGTSTQFARAVDQEKREPFEPSFSADGSRVVYRADLTRAGEVLASSSEIWIIRRDGSGAQKLTSGFKDRHPRISPDGRWVSFTRADDIWVVGTDGSDLRNATSTNKAVESQAEFTRKGELVFLRKASEQNTSTPAPSVFTTSLRQSVVLHRLEDKSERTLLGDGYEITQLIPNPTFDNAIFMLCKPLDNAGRPRSDFFTSEKVVAVVMMDGSGARLVYAPPAESKIVIEEVRITPQRNIVIARTPGKLASEPMLLENDKLVPLPNAPIMGDITQDGKTIVGTGIVYGQESLFGLVLYDFETKKRQSLISSPR